MSENPRDKRDPRSSNRSMKPDHPDPSHGANRIDRGTLAALIDGRLKGAERDAALARLAASPDDLEIVADAVAVAVADELDEPLDIRDAMARRGRRPALVKWLAVAAAILFAVVLPMTMNRGAAPGVNFASLLSGRVALAPGWEQHSWSATRGASDGMTERARAVRAGALTSAIDVAAARGGDSVTARLAAQMAALFVDVPGAGSVVTTYRDIASRNTPPAPERLRDARRATRDVVSQPAFDNGAWLEVARVAALDHDSAFFAASESREQLGRLERETAGDARARDEVLSVGRLIEQHDWDALRAATTNVLALLAGP